MKNASLIKPAWILGAATAVLATSIGVRAAQSTPQNGQNPPAAAAESQDEEKFAALGEETTEKICIICHPWENITRTRRTQKEWNDTVINMAQRGAPGTDPQFAIVKKFLTRYYGVVSINTAPATEIAAVLGLSAKEAEAIVEYRKAHGKFTDAASVLKVEGVDKTKIEEQPEALRFN